MGTRSQHGEVMKVAVITPYYKEEAPVLERCHHSVAAQMHECVHFMLADGVKNEAVATWDVAHVILPTGHDDNGDTPRCIGGLLAANEGFDAIAFLDADNWFQPNHIASLVQVARESSAPVCVSSRSIHRVDGSLMTAFDPESDGDNHVDTSCLFLTRPAFGSLPVWGGIPKALAPLADRIFWRHLQRRYPIALTRLPTMAFRTRYGFHYKRLGEAPPECAKQINRLYRWWSRLTVSQTDAVVRWAETYSEPDRALLESIPVD
jgi:hypothetical protein